MQFVSRYVMTAIFIVGTLFQIKFCLDYYEWQRDVMARFEVQRERAEQHEMFIKYLWEHSLLKD